MRRPASPSTVAPARYIFRILHDFPASEVEVAWRRLLAQIECPAHYDGPEFFSEPFWQGLNPFAVLAFADSAVVGVLTGLHTHKEVVCGLAVRPQLCLHPCADETSVMDCLISGLLEEAGGTKLVSVHTWPRVGSEFQRRGFRPREFAGVVVVDLSIGARALFDNFAPKRRRDIRLALRNGIEVSEQTTTEELKEYWELYSAWRNTSRKQILFSPLSFETMLKAYSLRESRRLFLARKDGKLIAASTIRFAPGGLIEYSGNCSLDEYLRLRPNDLLLWRILEWGCENGFKKCSLGGTDEFHRKWSESVVPIYRYRQDRTLLRCHDRLEGLVTTAHSVFQKLPAGVKERARQALRRLAASSRLKSVGFARGPCPSGLSENHRIQVDTGNLKLETVVRL